MRSIWRKQPRPHPAPATCVSPAIVISSWPSITFQTSSVDELQRNLAIARVPNEVRLHPISNEGAAAHLGVA